MARACARIEPRAEIWHNLLACARRDRTVVSECSLAHSWCVRVPFLPAHARLAHRQAPDAHPRMTTRRPGRSRPACVHASIAGVTMTRRMKNTDRYPHYPDHIRLLILAAERECPQGHARAFADLTAVALTKVPSRGIFDPAVRG